ncbi:hypothetical protein [Microcoleus sp. B9-D4]
MDDEDLTIISSRYHYSD